MDDAFSTSASFIVPAFFMVSDFLLRRGRNFTHREFEFKPFWKGKFFSLIVPFPARNVIYMLMYRFLDGRAVLSHKPSSSCSRDTRIFISSSR